MTPIVLSSSVSIELPIPIEVVIEGGPDATQLTAVLAGHPAARRTFFTVYGP
jgi:hypothetical protein